jgi:hypothetical protein
MIVSFKANREFLIFKLSNEFYFVLSYAFLSICLENFIAMIMLANHYVDDEEHIAALKGIVAKICNELLQIKAQVAVDSPSSSAASSKDYKNKEKDIVIG